MKCSCRHAVDGATVFINIKITIQRENDTLIELLHSTLTCRLDCCILHNNILRLGVQAAIWIAYLTHKGIGGILALGLT